MAKSLDQSTSNESKQICSSCGGDCCRTKPGIEAPERFQAGEELAESLAEHLASGYWVLDHHYGLPPTQDSPGIPAADLELFYPRPANRGELHMESNLPAEKAMECVFLDHSGCRLPFAERPLMCRALKPAADFNCSSDWTRREAALSWYPWQQEVARARRLAALLGNR